MSYAQLDPLVIYKKESFEKFQELLANITNNTASYLLKLDFDAIAVQQSGQLIQEESNEEKVIEILTSASRNIAHQPSKPETEVQDSRAEIFDNSNDTDVEVFEVED